MFVRKKKNKSGSVSIQVIQKSSKKYRVVRSFGSATDRSEVLRLERHAKKWIKTQKGQLSLIFENEDRSKIETVLDEIDQVKSIGLELLLDPIFKTIGFDIISDELFKKLVFSRIEYPVSKHATTQHWALNHGLKIHPNTVYRYMDELHSEHKELLQRISFEHSKKLLDGKINIAFYDVTTLYFETDTQDELRKTGFSKEGKHQNPQIILGLLVSKNGYPLAYEIFEGNKFEGHTMLPIINQFCEKYKIKKIIVVADSGLISSKNIDELIEQQYEFIIGARIKNSKNELKEKILSLDLSNGETATIKQSDAINMIISFSDKRAKKDARNRERGLEKLRKKMASGKLNKSNINNRGYNKYLKLEGEVSISIDEDKFSEDARWDGLKGYLTNTKSSADEVISNYGELWKIEKAFRISKSNLRIRPIFHRIKRRIECHICISFVAYKIYKELERQLYDLECEYSPEKAIKIAKSIYEVRVPLADGGYVSRVLLLHPDQQKLGELFDF